MRTAEGVALRSDAELPVCVVPPSPKAAVSLQNYAVACSSRSHPSGMTRHSGKQNKQNRYKQDSKFFIHQSYSKRIKKVVI
jgi:hypothetical protein